MLPTKYFSSRLGICLLRRTWKSSSHHFHACTSFSTTTATTRPSYPTPESSSRSHSNNNTFASSSSPYIQGDETHFGFESVGVAEKEGRVRQVFENVADSYDVMNDLMSGGLHRYWKDQLLDMSAVASMAKALHDNNGTGEDDAEENTSQRLQILDVAGGTGDVAFRFVEAAAAATQEAPQQSCVNVTVCDINPEMLRVGEARARERFGNDLLDNTSRALSFVEGNAQDLQFDDNSFDLYTIAFGLRNVTDVDKGLAEAYRVLKPGGRFMCLEFSQVPDPLLRQIYDAYSFHVIPGMGEIVANDRASYQYLVESIRKFTNQEELLARMDAVGFQLTKYTNMTAGIVAVHEGWKPLEI